MLKQTIESLIKIPGAAQLLIILRGISQVVLINNALTGAVILFAIATVSIPLTIAAFVSSAIGTLTAYWGGADKNRIRNGLFGFNSVLTGMGLILYLSGPYKWIIALACAFITSFMTAALMRAMTPTGLPVLSIPFILITWMILLASYRLKAFTLTTELMPQNLSNWKLDISGSINWATGLFDGARQVFFLQNSVAGILILIGISIAGWKLGVYALLGNMAALATAYVLGAEHALIDNGLFGYNAVLAAVAIGSVYRNPHNKLAPLSAIIASCLTVLVISAVDSWLLPYGLPALTFPFVLSTWILLGARKTQMNF
ncbi:urea transporter [Neobacillus notoginsengisoli]|uniref:Urea transporter n=1 Tax=Neobacillus notoginsengisoli TaxID=1578198 RepID=A0A417YGZ0_9BACI|nr:urea transporter [Neobacillus notoginsengisoli]RHW32137.1 urea transporter [Neobacillus notoginsengisoli]